MDVIFVMGRIKGTHRVIPGRGGGISSVGKSHILIGYCFLDYAWDSSSPAPRNDFLCHFMLNNSNSNAELSFLVERSDIGKGPGGWVYHPLATAHHSNDW